MRRRHQREAAAVHGLRRLLALPLPLRVRQPVLASCTSLKKNADGVCCRLRSDPSEHVDLARTEAGVYESLLARFKELEDGYHPPKANPPMDTQGVCDAIRANGGFLRPWK